MNIFFFVKTSKVNGKYLDKYIEDYLRNNKVNVISTLEGLKKVKELDWVYYNQGLITSPDYKKYEKIFERIKVNTFCFVDYKKPNIFNKNYLHNTLKKYEKPEIFKKYFMDQIEVKDKSDIDNFMIKDKTYIVKPIPGSGGLGIKVFNDPKKVYDYISNYRITKNISEKKKIPITKVIKWVLQEYIDNPLLLNGKKFHIRAFCFVYSKNNIKKFYLFNKYFIYIAVKKFVLNNFNNTEIHNTHGTKLTKNDVVNATRDFYKMPEKILSKINEQIVQICKIIKKYIRYNCYNNNKECFSYIGFDFMVNNNYEVKCIEINQRPGLSQFQVSEYIDDFFQGMVDITLYKENSAKDYTEIIDDEKKSIFFYEPEFKNIKELLPKNYEVITLNELKNKKYIDWVYWSSLLSKKYKNILYNIDSDYRNHLNYEILIKMSIEELYKEINELNKLYENKNTELKSIKDKTLFYQIELKYELTGYNILKILNDNNIKISSTDELVMYEILNEFKQIIPVKKEINTFHLCEFPGSFIKGLSFYLKNNLKINKLNWNAQSSYKKKNDIYNFVNNHPDKWIFTKNKKIKEIDELKKYCNNIDLLTINCNLSDNLEENLDDIIRYNILFVLNNLPNNANCIMKLFLPIFSETYLYMIYLCKKYFKNIYFYKPMINYTNNEFYLIGINKKNIPRDILNELFLGKIKRLDDNNFLTQIYLYSKRMIIKRNNQISRILYLYNNENKLTTKDKEEKEVLKKQKVFSWIKKFIL